MKHLDYVSYKQILDQEKLPIIFLNIYKGLNCNIKCIKNFKNLYRQRITQ